MRDLRSLSSVQSLCLRASVVCLLLTCVAAGIAAPQPVSYGRQIRPLFEKQCLGCHSGPSAASGYSMSTRDLLLKGGRHGVAVVPGKGEASSLVQYMTGKRQPKMPPGGVAMDMETVNLVRRWIDEGAKFDDAKAAPVPGAKSTKLPNVLPSASAQPAPVTALAFAPDGKSVAAGGYRGVRLLDPATGAVTRTVRGMADQVQALAWSGDGKFLAVAGGAPGEVGEVLVFNTQTWKQVRRLGEHTDVVYAVAWRPNTVHLVTGSLDKTARVWDLASGKCIRVLKDHADAVMGVAYSADGKWLATGSADRSVKLIDVAAWKRVAALTGHQDAVTRVAFNHDGTLLATAGADKVVCVWKIEPGKMENPQRRLHENDVINACAFSPDGSLFVYGASNKVVKLFNGDGAQHKRTLSEPQDWVYSVAVGADNDTIAAGTQDGRVWFWSVKQEKPLRSVQLSPSGAKVIETAQGVAK